MPGAKRPTSTKAKSKSKAATSRTPSLLEALNAVAPPKKLPPGLTAGALPDLVGTSPSTSVDPATKEALLSALMAGKLREGALVGAVRSSLTRESLDALALELLRFSIPTIELRKRTGRGKSRTPMPLAEAPPIAFSEAVLDLSDVLVEQDAR